MWLLIQHDSAIYSIYSIFIVYHVGASRVLGIETREVSTDRVIDCVGYREETVNTRRYAVAKDEPMKGTKSERDCRVKLMTSGL